MTEREMFLEWLCDNTSYDHVYIRGEREEGGVFHSDLIQSLWKAWQASASRGGYKLVPVESLESVRKACNNALDINNIDIYKGLAMAIIDDCEEAIGVVE